MSPPRARTTSSWAVTGVKALRQYAFAADGYRGALLSPDGEVSWMCFPGWCDGALFAGLLGSGGVFRVAPAASSAPAPR